MIIMIMIMITSYQYNMLTVTVLSKCHCTPHCSSVIVTFIVHYITRALKCKTLGGVVSHSTAATRTYITLALCVYTAHARASAS